MSRCGLYDQAKLWSSQVRRMNSRFEAKERRRERERGALSAARNTGGAWCVRGLRWRVRTEAKGSHLRCGSLQLIGWLCVVLVAGLARGARRA